MGKELSQLSPGELRQLISDCRQAISEICDSVTSTPEVQDLIQRILGQPELLDAFMENYRQEPRAAAQLFTAAFSNLINSQTAFAIERELLRRSAANNYNRARV